MWRSNLSACTSRLFKHRAFFRVHCADSLLLIPQATKSKPTHSAKAYFFSQRALPISAQSELSVHLCIALERCTSSVHHQLTRSNIGTSRQWRRKEEALQNGGPAVLTAEQTSHGTRRKRRCKGTTEAKGKALEKKSIGAHCTYTPHARATNRCDTDLKCYIIIVIATTTNIRLVFFPHLGGKPSPIALSFLS